MDIPWILALLTLLTATLSGVFGMAGGLILMYGATALLPLPEAMVFHGFIQMVANGSRSLLWFRHIQWGWVGPYMVGAVLASGLLQVFWIWVPNARPDRIGVDLLLGGLALSTGFWHIPSTPNRWNMGLCGGLVTGLQGWVGVAGPLLDVFFVHAPLSPPAIVATKAITQVFSHALKIQLWWSMGAMVPSEIGWSPIAALIGTLIGGNILERWPAGSWRRWTVWIIRLMGIFHLLRGGEALLV